MSDMPTITAEERTGRRARVAALVKGKGLACAVALDTATVTYLTGNTISGPNAVLVEANGGVTIVCDGYDTHNFDSVGDGIAIETYPYTDSPAAHVAAAVRARAGAGDGIGIEFAGMAHTARRALEEGLPGMALTAIDDEIGDMRLVKSPGEVAVIRRAARIVQEAQSACAGLLKTPTTEHDLAKTAYRTMIDGGSDYVASQPYIKSGPRALLTHARWGDRAVATGDHAFLELGACVGRYHAALMRCRPRAGGGADYERALNAVVEGRDRHMAVLKPGITAEDLHRAYLDTLEDHGVRAWNRHGSGYSLGIAYPPYWGEIQHLTLNIGSTRRLEAGMVLHVIAGLTDPERDIPHIGLSECVLVTEDACEKLIEMDDFL